MGDLEIGGKGRIVMETLDEGSLLELKGIFIEKTVCRTIFWIGWK